MLAFWLWESLLLLIILSGESYPPQDSASLATRLEGLEKDLEALKAANAEETERLNAELTRTNEVRSTRC